MNVHSSRICEGCKFHSFPYKAAPPLPGYGKRLFESQDDIDEVIELLINEAKEWNKEGKNFDIAQSISKQLPFFCCPNSILRDDHSKSIQKYIYCNETSTPAYSGDYGSQPSLWIQKYFIIKHAFAQKEKAQIDGSKR